MAQLILENICAIYGVAIYSVEVDGPSCHVASMGQARGYRAEIGRVVRRLREESELSQERFAAQAGFDRTYIGKLERGEVNVTIDTLARLAHSFGVSVSMIILEAEQPRNGVRG